MCLSMPVAMHNLHVQIKRWRLIFSSLNLHIVLCENNAKRTVFSICLKLKLFARLYKNNMKANFWDII